MKTKQMLLTLALAAALPAADAQTAKWPDKPVRVVVPFAPGGSTDIIARVLTARLSQEFGQQFVVDNRSGAGGSIGTDIVVRANPDGYTVIIVATSYATNAALYKLSYDPVKDIAPVGMLHKGPFVVAVNNSVPATSVKELIELARAKPGGLTYGSSGIGGATHLATELFLQMTKTGMVHVPYKGDAPAIADLLGGQIQLIFSSVPALIPHLKAGRLRGLAVTTEKRFPELPDLPAVAETLPGYEHTSWNGMWGPAGMPKEIVMRLNEIARAHPQATRAGRAAARRRAGARALHAGRIPARDLPGNRQVAEGGQGRQHQSSVTRLDRGSQPQ